MLSAIFSSSVIFRCSSISSSLLLQVFRLKIILALWERFYSKFQVFLWFFRKIFSVSFNLSIVLRLLKCEITQLAEKLNSELDEKVKTVLFSGEAKWVLSSSGEFCSLAPLWADRLAPGYQTRLHDARLPSALTNF